MPSLHQILAIEKPVRTKAARVLTDAHHLLAKQPLLAGITRTYRPRDEDGDLLPPEATRVQVRAEDTVRLVSKQLAELFDVMAIKDWTNTTAKADVVVGDQILLADVPVSYLLFLEAQLVDLHTFVTKLPTLDPSDVWTYSNDVDCFVTAPIETVRTRKVPRGQVLYEATEQHAAQVHLYHEDVEAGRWTTTKLSGALPARRVAELVERVEVLQKAVKQAREHANSVAALDVSPGETVMRYLFG